MNSSEVTAGDDALASQYNNLRTDVIGAWLMAMLEGD